MRQLWRNNRRIFRFLLTGTLNTAFGYGLFVLLIYAGLYPALALLVATVAGVVFNFVTFGSYVFSHRSAAGFFRFVAVYATTYVINVVLIELLTRYAGQSPQVAQALSLLVVVPVTYFLLRDFVYAR